MEPAYFHFVQPFRFDLNQIAHTEIYTTLVSVEVK